MSTKIRSILIHLATFGILLMFDQISKIWAANTLSDGKTISIIPGVIEFSYLQGGNKGAAWGLFSGKISFLLILTICICICIICLYTRSLGVTSDTVNYSAATRKKFFLLQFIFSMLLAGAVGNIIDRIRLNYVIDFLHATFIDFPIFNVADCYVVVSSILIVLTVLFYFKEPEFDLLFSRKKSERTHV